MEENPNQMTGNGTDPVKCPVCEAENRPSRLFCTNCGAYLRPADEQTVGSPDQTETGAGLPSAPASGVANKTAGTSGEVPARAPAGRADTGVRPGNGTVSVGAGDLARSASNLGGYGMNAPRKRPRRSRVATRIYAVILFLVLVAAAYIVGQLVYGTFFNKNSASGPTGTASFASTTTSAVSTTRTTAKDSSTTPTSGGSTTTRTTGQVLGSPVIPKSQSASSVLAADGSNTYVADNLVDNSLATAWSEGVGNPGLGEWVRFEFGKSVRIDRIEIANGYQKDSQRFRGNPRVRTIQIDYSDGSQQLVNLYDITGYQYITATGPATTYMMLTIVSVYPGDEWEDTSLSEIRFFGSPG
jgi:hypothetical protein